MMSERMIIKMNKNLDSLFNSMSSFPTLVLAYFEFIIDLVSIPVNITIPRI